MSMKIKTLIIIILLFVSSILSGCEKGPYKPEGTIGVQELLEKPVYGEEIKLYGQVTMKGVIDEGCFDITYIGKNIRICSILTNNFNNGDRVIITGKYQQRNPFTANKIELTQKEN